MIIVNNVGGLSGTFQSFLNLSDISVVNNMATISGQLVCSNVAVRDELAMTAPPLIRIDNTTGTFSDGASLCGDCGKLCTLTF